MWYVWNPSPRHTYGSLSLKEMDAVALTLALTVMLDVCTSYTVHEVREGIVAAISLRRLALSIVTTL